MMNRDGGLLFEPTLKYDNNYFTCACTGATLHDTNIDVS